MDGTVTRWTVLATVVLGCAGCAQDPEVEACHTLDTGSVSGSDGGANSTEDGSETAGSWWKPTPGTTWQWQLSEAIDTSIDVEMYDIDLFDAPTNTIDALHADGRVVICYFSAGTYEDWRADKDEFTSADYGKVLPDWPGEFWVDHRSANVRRIMQDRLDMAVDKNCDGVEPDNMDGYANDNGLGLQCADQLDYNRFIAAEAHARDLSVGLKNAVELVAELEPDYDWALNEECFEFDECETLRPFLTADKAVFHSEYVNREGQGENKRDDVCGNVPAGFSTLIKLWDLNTWYLTCP